MMQKNIIVHFLLILFLFIFTRHHLSGEKINERIFDSGSEVPIDAYPWMVSIRLNIMNLMKRDCSGVILSDIFLLTAASCFQNLTIFAKYFTIKAGIDELSSVSETTEQVRVMSQLILHPHYTSHFYLNDLALIRVSPPFKLNILSVFPIELSDLLLEENMNLTTIGWGVSNQANPRTISTSLQEGTVQENVECTQNTMANPITQLCASGTCVGDTGSPLMVYSNEKQQYELVGITSFREACTTESLFTRIAPFIKWILEIMKKPPPTPPPQSTYPTLPSTVPTTTTPEIVGPPITFICNTSYSCGCSSIPVVFHDGYPISSTEYYNPIKIVGGEIAQAHSWPWIVSLRMSLLGHICSGSLINNEWVLTAAHCLPSTSTTVHIGVHDEKLPSPLICTVEEVIVHPNYIPAPKYLNDIALIRISPPVNFTIANAYAGSSCLPPAEAGINYPKVNTRLAVIGWGKLVSGGSRPTKLHQVRVNTLANNDWRCVNSSFDSDRQFCAMVDGGGKDSCQGDSGGPIHQWLNDHWEQVGIVSFGTGCGLANHPGVYTRLSVYYDWIQSNVNENNQTTYIPTSTTYIPTLTTEAITTSNAIDVKTTDVNTAVVFKTNMLFYVLIYVGLQFFSVFDL